MAVLQYLVCNQTPALQKTNILLKYHWKFLFYYTALECSKHCLDGKLKAKDLRG